MLIMKKSTKINFAKHITVIIFFIITAVLFFSPVLKGKKILQNDIVQYSGMSKELKDYRLNYDVKGYGSDFRIRYGFLYDKLEMIISGVYQNDNFADNRYTPVNDIDRKNFKKFKIGAKY